MRRSGAVLLVLTLVIATAKWRRKALEPSSDGAETATLATDEATPLARRDRTPAAASVKAAAPAPVPPIARAEDFERYGALARKVFTTDDESDARSRLVHDADLLVEAGRALVRRETSPALLERQNQALALLLEAAAAGDAIAARALIGVVHDAGVEDAGLPRATRENLAGLKAEAMYRWSANSPANVASIEAALPGNVSRKLWQNAVARQRANLVEGAAVGSGARVAGRTTSEDEQ